MKNIIIAVSIVMVFMGIALTSCKQPFTPPPGETEAREFQGVTLTPIGDQGNNAIAGTQRISRETYVLTVDGLVTKPLSLSYSDLLAYPAESRLINFECVEGWGFTAKTTGPRLADILNQAGIKPEARIAIFHATDSAGYTSLTLSYILEKNIMLAMRLNDVTLPQERGFPFQVCAEGKYGYKWAKWVTRIELSSDENFRGYWETEGYNNNADIGGPAFDR